MLDGDSVDETSKTTHVNLLPFLHCLDRDWFHHHHEALLYALSMSEKKKKNRWLLPLKHLTNRLTRVSYLPATIAPLSCLNVATPPDYFSNIHLSVANPHLKQAKDTLRDGKPSFL